MNDPINRPRRHQASAPEKRDVAVALTYDAARDSLPRVIASGRGVIARRLLDLAFENGVKVREDADLVEILAALDLESEIPTEAILAVAEILAQVYRANERAMGNVPKDPGQ